MKHGNAPENQTTRRIMLIACATALAVGFMVSLPQPTHAQNVTPHPCRPTFRCHRGTRRSSRVTASAPRTTSACLQPPQSLASPLYSSRRRPPCSGIMISKSSPISTAPTRLRVARFASRGSTPETRAGFGDRCCQVIPRPTPISSRRVPFPGSSLLSLEPKTDPPEGTR